MRGGEGSSTRRQRYQQEQQPLQVRYKRSLILCDVCVELSVWPAVMCALNSLVDGFYFWHRCEFPSVATAMLGGKW